MPKHTQRPCPPFHNQPKLVLSSLPALMSVSEGTG
jgi:hypothetical protein